jgi:hypothetical protein
MECSTTDGSTQIEQHLADQEKNISSKCTLADATLSTINAQTNP